jgi:hypothetical protein
MNDLVKTPRLPNVRQLAQLLHTVLDSRRFSSRTDLIETFKDAAAVAPVPYDGASINAAIEMVAGGRRRREIPTTDTPCPTATNAPADASRYIGRSEAADLLARIQRRAQAAGPRTMPAGAAKGPA